MGQDPSELRARVEETRERVGEEVDALSYKTDVGARVGDYVAEKKEAVTSKLSRATDTVKRPIPDRQQVSRLKSTAEQNPLGLALGGAAVGFVVGLLLPSTRVEDEKLGPASERLGETAGEAWQHGKQVAQEAAQSAVETAKESGREHGEELTSALQERTQQRPSESPWTDQPPQHPEPPEQQPLREQQPQYAAPVEQQPPREQQAQPAEPGERRPAWEQEEQPPREQQPQSPYGS